MTDHTNHAGDVIEAICSLFARFADHSKIDNSQRGLRPDGIVVLYQNPEEDDGEVFMVRFIFVTKDGHKVQVDFDFRVLSRDYISSILEDMLFKLNEAQEARLAQNQTLILTSPGGKNIEQIAQEELASVGEAVEAAIAEKAAQAVAAGPETVNM